MSEIKSWRVASNSFGKAESQIQGETLGGAIEASIGSLIAGALPQGDRWRPLTLKAEWQPGILKGRGGVEIEIDAVFTAGGDDVKGRFIAWVSAPRADLREPVSFPVAA